MHRRWPKIVTRARQRSSRNGDIGDGEAASGRSQRGRQGAILSSGRKERDMPDEMTPQPDSTAVRVALWRAMHVQVDPPPHVIEDEVGPRLAAPGDDWRRRPDMDARATRAF